MKILIGIGGFYWRNEKFNGFSGSSLNSLFVGGRVHFFSADKHMWPRIILRNIWKSGRREMLFLRQLNIWRISSALPLPERCKYVIGTVARNEVEFYITQKSELNRGGQFCRLSQGKVSLSLSPLYSIECHISQSAALQGGLRDECRGMGPCIIHKHSHNPVMQSPKYFLTERASRNSSKTLLLLPVVKWLQATSSQAAAAAVWGT